MDARYEDTNFRNRREETSFSRHSARYPPGKGPRVRPGLLACGKCGCARRTWVLPKTWALEPQPRRRWARVHQETIRSMIELTEVFGAFWGRGTSCGLYCGSFLLVRGPKKSITQMLDPVVSSGTSHTRWGRGYLGARIRGDGYVSHVTSIVNTIPRICGRNFDLQEVFRGPRRVLDPGMFRTP